MRCLICGSERIMPTIWGGYCFEGIKYEIVSCALCGFTFIEPMPDDAAITRMYNDEYFKKFYCQDNGSYMEDILDNDIKKIKTLRQFKNAGNLLDIGSGTGRFLELALKEGYSCYALEPNSSEAEKVSRLLNIEVYNSTLEKTDLPAEKFDIIHVGDTLEHVKDPWSFIFKIKPALRDDGIFMLDLPITYNKNIFNYFLRMSMFFKKNAYSLNPPYHLLEFNRKNINIFFKKSKMRVLKSELYENRPISVNFNRRNKLKFYCYYATKAISYIFSAYLGGKNLGFGDRITIISRKDG